MKFSTICLYTFIITSFIFPITNDVNAFNTDRFIEGFKHPKKEVALTYQSDSFSIIRGSAEFHFSPGEITIFNFGGGVDCAIHYKGNCRFVYNPPDNVERAQLIKFFETEKIDNTAKSVSILFTVPLEVPFDSFTKPVSGKNSKAAGKISKAVKDAYNNIGIDILDWLLLNDLLTDEPGTYFYADFKLDKIGHIAFCENPYSDDYFQLYKLLRSAGVETYNYVSGYSPDNGLPSYRGVMPIDITHYDINSKIEGNGKMIVNCRIHYTPLRNNRKYLMFLWYKKNELHCAFDSNGDSLKIIHRNIKGNEDWDIGIILNEPIQLGKNDYIDINFECESLDNLWGVYSIKGQTIWYPRSIIRDLAAFRLVYNYPKKYEVVSCGNLVDLHSENGRNISVWNVDRPVDYVSFNIGAFNSKEIIEDNQPVVRVYLAKYIPHEDIAHILLAGGVSSTRDMLANVGADVVNSLAFFSSVIAPCPFDTIRVSEIPYRHGQGSPGLIHLSWETYQTEDMEGWDEKFRAHEVSHQWWGHMLEL